MMNSYYTVYLSNVEGNLMTRQSISIALMAVCGCVLWSPAAHAYLDPGTGSMLLQLLLGGLAGAAVIGRAYWGRLKNLFGHARPSKNDTDHDDQRR